jgi:hypothetical protein
MTQHSEEQGITMVLLDVDPQTLLFLIFAQAFADQITQEHISFINLKPKHS